jgi:hypothetical protein
MGPFYKHKQKIVLIVLLSGALLIGVRFISLEQVDFTPIDHHHHLVHNQGNLGGHGRLLNEVQKLKLQQSNADDSPSPPKRPKKKPKQPVDKQLKLQQPIGDQDLQQQRADGEESYGNEVNDVRKYDSLLKDMERIVHIDLKGAPPKPDYYKKFIPFVKKQGATGILLEYEDTFPFTGKLAEAKHGHAYTLEDIKMIRDLIKENGLTLMPLVQTYGHLEWLLKIKSFAHLREDARFPQVITPCLEESYTVLYGKRGL